MNGQMLARQSSFTNKITLAIVCVVGGFFCIAPTALAVAARAPQVQTIDSQSHAVEHEWLAFDDGYQGGVTVASGDIDGDHKNEIIVAQSEGADAHGLIAIFRTDGTRVAAYQLFAQDIIGAEIDLATGNVDDDAADEIVVSVVTGTRSMVYIFDGELKFDADTVGAFEAFPGVDAGATVAVGDVAGDDRDEIIVGTGQGVPSNIRIFNSNGKFAAKEINPFAATDTQGVTLAVLEHDDAHADIAVGLRTGNTIIKQYRIDAEQAYPVVNETAAWSREFKSGVSLAGWDANNDGQDEVVVAPAGDQQAEVRVLNHEGKQQLTQALMVYEEDFRGGADIAVAQLDADTAEEYIIAPRVQKKRGDTARPSKYIEVNLTEQIEYVWEDAYLRNVYLISSGLAATPSPEGEWSVLKKIANHVYDGRPAYFFPNTPWNLMYKAGGPERNYYLHTAYWHNNFGRPQSHGCVNMREADAKFIYFWADIGTPVWIHK